MKFISTDINFKNHISVRNLFKIRIHNVTIDIFEQLTIKKYLTLVIFIVKFLIHL